MLAARFAILVYSTFAWFWISSDLTADHSVPARVGAPVYLPTSAHPDSSVLGVFEGRTPCGPIVLEFAQFPEENCEKVKLQVTLYGAGASAPPTSYLARGTRGSRRGRVSVRHGTPEVPGATVYQLHYDSARVFSLLEVGSKVLLVLDQELRVLAGNASWSYTLNRIR